MSKNQCFLVEDDYLDRANVDVIKGELKKIDVNTRTIDIKNHRKPIQFDKVIVSWGSTQDKLATAYSNVHYIEDRFTHAKVHNEILKAKKIVILGNSLDAIQIASSTRDYLDSIGRFDAKI